MHPTYAAFKEETSGAAVPSFAVPMPPFGRPADVLDASDERTAAATKLQAGFRGMRSRKEQRRRADAAAVIQSSFRASRARSDATESIAEVDVDEAEREAAASKLQAGFRGMRERREQRRRADAAAVIQASFRASRSPAEAADGIVAAPAAPAAAAGDGSLEHFLNDVDRLTAGSSRDLLAIEEDTVPVEDLIHAAMTPLEAASSVAAMSDDDDVKSDEAESEAGVAATPFDSIADLDDSDDMTEDAADSDGVDSPLPPAAPRPPSDAVPLPSAAHPDADDAVMLTAVDMEDSSDDMGYTIDDDDDDDEDDDDDYGDDEAAHGDDEDDDEEDMPSPATRRRRSIDAARTVLMRSYGGAAEEMEEDDELSEEQEDAAPSTPPPSPPPPPRASFPDVAMEVTYPSGMPPSAVSPRGRALAARLAEEVEEEDPYGDNPECVTDRPYSALLSYLLPKAVRRSRERELETWMPATAATSDMLASVEEMLQECASDEQQLADAMLPGAVLEAEERVMQQLRAIFHSYDVRGSGQLNLKQAAAAARSLGLDTTAKRLRPIIRRVAAPEARLDALLYRRITLPLFLRACDSLVADGAAVRKRELQKLLDCFSSADGSLPLFQLQRLLAAVEMPSKLDMDELNDFVSYAGLGDLGGVAAAGSGDDDDAPLLLDGELVDVDGFLRQLLLV
eukprot:PLAT3616.6.p1 GENE.PLAT3616.6~~PLAT3616.6.p1  ORF type:complete len:744 (+),score=359.70 PLAT3616.6:194-2233(+)